VESDAASFYSYLRAQVIVTWVHRHPSPPPFNLILLVSKPLAWLVKLCFGQKPAASVSTHVDPMNKMAPDQHEAMFLAMYGGSLSFSLVANYTDRKHSRVVAKLIAADIEAARYVEPAPGVKEMQAQLERMSVEPAPGVKEMQAQLERMSAQLSEQQSQLAAVLGKNMHSQGGDLSAAAQRDATVAQNHFQRAEVLTASLAYPQEDTHNVLDGIRGMFTGPSGRAADMARRVSLTRRGSEQQPMGLTPWRTAPGATL